MKIINVFFQMIFFFFQMIFFFQSIFFFLMISFFQNIFFFSSEYLRRPWAQLPFPQLRVHLLSFPAPSPIVFYPAPFVGASFRSWRLLYIPQLLLLYFSLFFPHQHELWQGVRQLPLFFRAEVRLLLRLVAVLALLCIICFSRDH